ncbi:MAG: hypothetical protein ACJ0F5_03190 [Candidatus Actinomarina sp.]|tara:strand:- start:812 stop:1462 length:651 start_codon:yes stop_codon:yes gene_type:complete
MKNSNFTEYKFKNYDVRGLKLEINFSKNDSIKIKAHEEINIPIENHIDESFDPLLFGIDMNLEIIKNIDDLKGKKMILLDGHHRYEYLKRNNIDKTVEIILISTDDVKILSYPSYLLIEQKEFVEILENYNFSNKVSSKFFVSLNDIKFFNNEIENIYELYEFKNLCFRNEYISTVNNENQPNDKTIINFTPVKVSEIVDSDTLFPPKSTWITPRL